MRLPVRVWLGMALFACGAALWIYSEHRLAPRPTVVMDRPIRLADGHFSTGPFQIPNEWGVQYFADIVLTDAPHRMPASCDPEDVMETAFVQRADAKTREGRQNPWGNEHGLTIAYVWSGDYDEPHDHRIRHAINMNFHARSACLDAFHPRVRIETHPYPSDAYQNASFLGFLLIVVGLVLPVQGTIARRARAGTLPRMFPELRLRHLIPWRAQRPFARFIAFPYHFAPSLVGLELVLITIFMTITPTTPQGLTIDLATRRIAKATDSPWPETMSLYVDARGVITLNGKVVAKEKLRARLEEELDRRMSPIVYVEADNDVEASVVIFAIDTAQSVGARIFWITPAVRAQWSAHHPLPAP